MPRRCTKGHLMTAMLAVAIGSTFASTARADEPSAATVETTSSRAAAATALEKQGHIVAAMHMWQLAGALAETPTELAEARAHARTLGARAARLVFQGDLAEGGDVTVDAQPVPRESFTTGVAVDAGAHEVVVTVPGHTPFKVSLSAGEGETRAVDLRAATDTAPRLLPLRGAPAQTSFAVPRPRGPLGESRAAHLAVGWTLIGTGVASGAAAATIAFTTPSHDPHLASPSEGVRGAPSHANDATNDATRHALAGAVAGAGFALVATGGYLLLTAPTHAGNTRVGATVTPSSGYVALTGKW